MRFVTNDTVKKKNTSSYRFSNFGFSTILLTFVMMCVVTFGVLALITANSDLKLSKKVKEKSAGYYAAEEAAYEKLTQLDAVLADVSMNMDVSLYGDTDSDTSISSANREYLSLVESAVAASEIGTYQNGTVSFSIPVTDTQSLSVVVTISTLADQESGYYTITTWETVHNEETDIIDDGTMNLMGN